MTPAELLLSLVLTGTQSHYEHPGVIDDKRLEHLLLAGKQILYKSHQESDVRQALGFSPKVWQGLTDCVSKGVDVLEAMCFVTTSKSTGTTKTQYTSVSDAIARNYLGLVKDIERLNDLCTIARNLLATTRKAQNLAAERGFDQCVLRVVELCVRVASRGFDGEGRNENGAVAPAVNGTGTAGSRNEERWQKVVNLYKRLLITCLQFLHNFIMHNEQRKLVLWLDLFGNAQSQAQKEDLMTIKEEIQNEADAEGRLRQTEEEIKSTTEEFLRASEKAAAEGSLTYSIDDVHKLFDLMSQQKEPSEGTQEQAKVLMEKIRADMEKISTLSQEEREKLAAAQKRQAQQMEAKIEQPIAIDQAVRNAVANAKANGGRTSQPIQLPDLTTYADVVGASQEITEKDLEMPRTSQSAAETLQEAKDELMARLQEPPAHIDENGEITYDEDPNGELIEDELLDSAEDSIEPSEEDDDDSYQRHHDQERGLLTDVPLVLGPTEIEALPMIIQAGIVDNFGTTKQTPAERQNQKNMQAVRCHILLAQEAGRNVLRELLIFIAAWDLSDDEFYFKMMVQIMEAILKNGLMSHAYSDFGQAKDIISPAQAVVIKILTHIFRAKYSPTSTNNGNEAPKPRIPAPLSRVDVLTVRYIFTVFRGNIVPETCALIYLQGQIRAGLALAEDFPLNLWDMERVYEGVYQFLEFFAVLTENNDWKRLLVEWEIVYDLVTLIKELDASIPKANLVQPPPPSATAYGTSAKAYVPDAQEAVEEVTHLAEPVLPDLLPVTDDTAAEPPLPTTSSESIPQIERPYSPLPPISPSPPPPLPLDDPALFEWRNLKKLIVLVLSSLVWKSPLVQRQIREHGGIDTILSCTQYDGHNPYIKEHAVMCIKFLLEGNEENQKLVSDLEANQIEEGGVKGWRDRGFEPVLGDGGRVELRRMASENSGRGWGRGVRRASEGAMPMGLDRRFGRMGLGRESGRVLDEEVNDV